MVAEPPMGEGLPSPGVAGVNAGGRSEPSDGLPAEVLALADRLADSPGLSLVYDTLDLLAARYQLDDAVVVTERTQLGRQAFRLGRRPATSPPGEWLGRVLQAEPGLYTAPETAVSAEVGRFASSLVTAAMRMALLSHDANHDPLTGLLNRRSYDEALDDALSSSRRYGWPFALVLLDLDNFKAVNDGHGHAAGDAALRAIGSELRRVLRRGDVAARLGGDEFAAVVRHAGSAAEVEPLVTRLRRRLRLAFPATSVDFSVGVAYFPVDATDGATLQEVADGRLYEDKAAA